MIKNVIVDATGRDSDLEAGSAYEGIIAPQALTCLMKEATLTTH